jgi:hypothetical protein
MYSKDNGILYSLFDYIEETTTTPALRVLGKVRILVLGTWATHQHST